MYNTQAAEDLGRRPEIEAAQPAITPAHIRYIKLGPGGAWEAACLDGGTIDWGVGPNPHQQAFAGDWDGAKRAYLDAGVAGPTATGFLRELREFYTLGADCLWITFARGHLWWAFAHPQVTLNEGRSASGGRGEASRKVIGQWRRDDVAGKPLRTDGLSSRLTQLAGYRGTICRVGPADYLTRRINAEDEPAVITARAARDDLVTAAETLIQHLHWRDFELLVDLLFTGAGWRRVSAVGGTMKDIDLLLEQPITNERASVQVKSTADQRTLDASIAAFRQSGAADRFFFVRHNPRPQLALDPRGDDRVHLWESGTLAAAAVDRGLTNWLIERAG